MDVVVVVIVVVVEVVVVVDVVVVAVVAVAGFAVASMSRILSVVVGLGREFDGLAQTTLHVQPSTLLGEIAACSEALNTSLRVSSPVNLRLAVLLPQYFLWKLTLLVSPLFTESRPFITLR